MCNTAAETHTPCIYVGFCEKAKAKNHGIKQRAALRHNWWLQYTRLYVNHIFIPHSHDDTFALVCMGVDTSGDECNSNHVRLPIYADKVYRKDLRISQHNIPFMIRTISSDVVASCKPAPISDDGRSAAFSRREDTFVWRTIQKYITI